MDGRRSVHAILTSVAVLVASLAVTYAQGPTGRIDGTVRDSQGGVLPGVTLTLRHQESGVTREAVTQADGRYAFPALAPGKYVLRAELTGFAREEISDIAITIGLERRLDVQLGVGTLQETVTVHAEAPVVDTTKAEVAGVVTRQQIETLPINSCQYLSLALLVPGTTVDATRSFFSTVERRRGDDFQRHRQRRRRHDQQLG